MNLMHFKDFKFIGLWMFVLFAVSHSASGSAYESYNITTVTSDLKTENRSEKGFENKIKLITLQVDSPEFLPFNFFNTAHCIKEQPGIVSLKPQSINWYIPDHRNRLQKYIFPFHLFW